MDISQRIGQLIGQHGGVRAAARAVNVDPAYFIRLWDGRKDNPSDKTLRKLGLKRVTIYRRIR